MRWSKSLPIPAVGQFGAFKDIANFQLLYKRYKKLILTLEYKGLKLVYFS